MAKQAKTESVGEDSTARAELARSTGDPAWLSAPKLPPKLQRGRSVEVHRRQLKKAPYNPRKISDDAKSRLREILDTIGLVSPITWNLRSGNIVGGHQRVTLLDDIMGTDDYRLDVWEVDLSDAEEREANLALNADQAQGTWDLEALRGLVTSDSIRLEATGFASADVHRLFGSSGLADLEVKKIDELADKLADARERQDKLLATVEERNDTEFYLVLVYRDSARVGSVLERLGLPDERFQDGERFQRALLARPDVAEPAPAAAAPKS